MNHKWKRYLTLFLALALLCALLPPITLTARADDPVYSGSCGDNLTWTLYIETGLLKIEGSGAMADYNYSAPWWSTREIITAVEFPEGITSIGNYAFYDCTGLSSITIPAGVTAIGASAFSSCTGLTSIELPAGITEIESSTFSGCAKLRAVTIPEGVSAIGKWAFFNCTGLSSITIPSGVTAIGKWAFSGCTSLTSIELPAGITEIESSTFSGCAKLRAVTIPEGVSAIESNAFENCAALTTVALPNSLVAIADGAFLGCSALTEISLPGGLRQLGTDGASEVNVGFGRFKQGVFEDCTSLTSVSFHEGLSVLGDYTFYGCSSLHTIRLPKSMTEIAYNAFYGCTSLTALVVPNPDCTVRQDVLTYYHEWGDTSEDLVNDYYYKVSSTQCLGEPANTVIYGIHDPEREDAAPIEEVFTYQGYDSYGEPCMKTLSLLSRYVENYAKVCGYTFYETGIFSDVKSGAWYEIPVAWAYGKGITGGVGEGRFGPNKKCTREQVMVFLWAANGSPEPESTVNPFKDVKKKDYYYKAVLWAVENGITGGIDDTHFGVGRVCDRAQVVTFLWAAAGSPEPETTENPFTDVKKKDYYYKAVLWAVENGITAGTTPTTFSPAKECTRAQVVTFLYAAYG